MWNCRNKHLHSNNTLNKYHSMEDIDEQIRAEFLKEAPPQVSSQYAVYFGDGDVEKILALSNFHRRAWIRTVSKAREICTTRPAPTVNHRIYDGSAIRPHINRATTSPTTSQSTYIQDGETYTTPAIYYHRIFQINPLQISASTATQPAGCTMRGLISMDRIRSEAARARPASR